MHYVNESIYYNLWNNHVEIFNLIYKKNLGLLSLIGTNLSIIQLKCQEYGRKHSIIGGINIETTKSQVFLF